MVFSYNKGYTTLLFLGGVYLVDVIEAYIQGYTTLLFPGGVYHVLGIGRIGIQP